MKALILDADRSLASIGGTAGVVETLGAAPVPINNGLADVRKTLSALMRMEQRASPNEFLEGVTQAVILPNQRAAEMGISCLVIDTASALADQEYEVHLSALNARREAKGQPHVDSLDQSTWGPYGDALTKLYQSLGRTEMTVIVTCHEKRVEDTGGFSTYEPNIRGSSSSKMLRSFDAVLFAKVKGTGDSTEFVWQTQPDQARPSARTRGVELPFEIPQNFGVLLTAFAAAGKPDPLVLILGESGTGKTTSLATLGDIPTD